MNGNAIILWYRQDLRLHDNPALTAAARTGSPVIPVYVWSPEEEERWAPGGANRWWLHQSLCSLEHTLIQMGSLLVVRRGPALACLWDLVRETDARAIYWNRRYEPAAIKRDANVKEEGKKLGLDVQSFNSALLLEPWKVKNRSGRPFRVFTPFWKTVLNEYEHEEPLPAPNKLVVPDTWPATLPIPDLELEPRVNWAGGLESAWSPGEDGAQAQLDTFVRDSIDTYSQIRNRPDVDGTSRLSPHLHFGEISPREIWHVAAGVSASRRTPTIGSSLETYLSEIGWREFAYHLLYHYSFTTESPLRPEFNEFPWDNDEGMLEAWQRGRTGYPIVDAGMRELWTTGWMHNRVRMVTASFLVKNCLVSWLSGAKWFWDTLVDADLASNTLGWQWTAGCGADAAPYFRIFNPILQGEKFDPDGVYVRRWIPELKNLPNRFIHKPWLADTETRRNAGVCLGQTYPGPLMDHRVAREQALLAYDVVKQHKGLLQ